MHFLTCFLDADPQKYLSSFPGKFREDNNFLNTHSVTTYFDVTSPNNQEILSANIDSELVII
jgi:hypothetical protein